MPKIQDLTGQRFGRLVAIKISHREKDSTFWLCKCDCGKEHLAKTGNLKAGRVLSCGCNTRLMDLAGTRFDRLVVIERAPNLGTATCWRCKCDCGNETAVTAGHLRGGDIKSCGCLRHESKYDHLPRDPNITTKDRPLGYDTWIDLKQRCLNPKHPRYEDYGGRGITVCDRWTGEDGFLNFYEDMGPRPGDDMTIDRINNSLGYFKENCRWATDLEQGQNTRKNKNITWRGKTMCITAWERELGFNKGVLHSRLREEWSVDRAFTTPQQT